MMPSRVTGGFAQSSSNSEIFFQGEVQSQVEEYSQINSNFGNPLSSIPGRGYMRPHSTNLSNTMFNSVPSSGPSIGASSLVTDANSGISAGPHLQRSASINTESYTRLPASPLSFSSNNISISGSSIIDGSSGMQNPNHDLVSKQTLPSQQGASTAKSSRIGQIQFPSGQPIPNCYIQDSITNSQLQKKPRLDIKREDVLEQQIMQQLMQRQDSMPLQSPNPQWQALIQQQRLRQQQQQLLQSMPQVQRTQFLQHQLRQQQLLQQRQQSQPPILTKRPVDGGLCSRRLQQYLYHQRQRPTENVIGYWKKFVAEYYSPRAKKKYCLSHYENVGHHSVGVFPQSAMEAWQCDICGSKSGRGFEATFQVLARLNEVNFGSGGVIEELMFLDLPRECRHPSGLLTLEYARAVQECVYEQSRVVREGQLRIIFTPDLKILSWEFCARRHEELLPRRLIAPQVNQLLQVAQKCQNTISESGRDGLSQQVMQTNSAMIVTAGRQLARSLELQSLNDFGFSKRYVRCLQIAEVVNSMKDLMDFCDVNKVGPIEGLRTFPRHAKIQKLEEMALHSGPSNSSQDTVAAAAGRGGNLGKVAAYPNLITRQNSINSIQQEQPASPFSTTTTTSLVTSQSIMHRTFPNPLIDCQMPIGQDLQQHVAIKKNTLPNQQPVSVQNPVGFENSSSVTTADENNGQETFVENNNFQNDSNGESVPPPSCYNETCKNEESEEFPPGLCVPNDTIPDEIEDYADGDVFLDNILDEGNFWK